MEGWTRTEDWEALGAGEGGGVTAEQGFRNMNCNTRCAEQNHKLKHN